MNSVATIYYVSKSEMGEADSTRLRVLGIPGSKLDTETGYPDRCFSWFSSVASGNCWDSVLK
jgi:hypothetical protein